MVAIAAYLFMLNIRKLNKNREVLKHQKHEMELQAKKLQDMNDFKDNTFNVLSHDLRSPVNALTSAMMLLDEKVITPEEFAMHRHELNSKLQSVSLLLENMLYWARTQMKGEEVLNITKLSVKNKTLRVMAVLKDAAQQKNINLTYDVADSIHVYADLNQLDIILRNLTSNAIKFTPSGGNVVISAREDSYKTHISVTDTGVGMTAEQINNLFKDNSHASTQGTSGERGTGLGLQLSNKFAQNNGGSIHVVSKPGKGTTFTLTLPNVQA
jgi:signal transduction histidine kinase